VKYNRREKNGRKQSQSTASPPNNVETIPFAQRLTCTIGEACDVTGLGRTTLYELIGTGRLRTTTVGRRRLVLVDSLLALLKANMSM
jgi:excisionase family DNA binding protein